VRAEALKDGVRFRFETGAIAMIPSMFAEHAELIATVVSARSLSASPRRAGARVAVNISPAAGAIFFGPRGNGRSAHFARGHPTRRPLGEIPPLGRAQPPGDDWARDGQAAAR
jgi:hypothetical protein